MGNEHVHEMEQTEIKHEDMFQKNSEVVVDPDALGKQLVTQVPRGVETDLAAVDPQNTEKKIKRQNQYASEMYNHAAYAILYNYIGIEEKRSKNQKPLLIMIGVFTGVQLICLNVIIFVLLQCIFYVPNEMDLTLLYDLLKFYIGATIVELLGMLWFMSKATFSSSHVKLLGRLIGDLDTNKNAEETEENTDEL